LISVANHGSFGLHDRQQLFDSVRCTSFLPESKEAAYQDNCDDNQGIHSITNEER